jgi:hypothetical protein
MGENQEIILFDSRDHPVRQLGFFPPEATKQSPTGRNHFACVAKISGNKCRLMIQMDRQS